MAPKVALLHIGTPKTGTSSIQRLLARAEADGSLLPHRYPLRRGERSQQKLAWLYLPDEDLPAYVRPGYSATARERYRRFLVDELRSSGGAVLSWEGLGPLFGPSGVSRLRRELESSGFSSFQVLLYVRDPADFYLSAMQEQLKGSYISGFVKDPASFRYPFRRAAETWEEVFPGSLIVRHFRPGPQFDVIDDFTDQLRKCLGVDLPHTSMRVNSTLSAEAMQILQDYRQTVGPDHGFPFPGMVKLVAFLQRTATLMPQTKPVLTDAVAAQIRVNHQVDAEFINARYGVDLGLRDVREPAGLPSRPSWRVEDILEAVDPAIVRQLLLQLACHELGTKRGSPLVRAGARAYRAVPPGRRPARLDSWLRSHFSATAAG